MTEEKLSWEDARVFCGNQTFQVGKDLQEKQASLLLTDSAHEFEVIDAIFPFEDVRFLWINCNDKETEGEWVCETDSNGTTTTYRGINTQCYHTF